MAIFLHRLFVALFLSFCLQVTSQTSREVQDLEQQYFDNFKFNRETVFLHFNKTALIPNENLWFSAYVYDARTESPNKETVNLEIDIYNSQGRHVDSQTVFVSAGKGSGFLELDSGVYPPGTYLLKASTNYMKNFKEDLSFTETFTIIGGDPVQSKQTTGYDLQLLPEGGHLVQGVLNAVGIKLIDDTGSGVPFTDARLINADQVVVTKFLSNRFGMSKFSFTPEKDEEYVVALTTNNGEEIRKRLGPAENKGISLISTIRDDHHLLTLRTNEATKADFIDQNLLVVLHKDGKLKDFEISFPQDKLEINISMHKDSLFPGVNTVTILDPRLKPISERKIFSQSKMKRMPVKAALVQKRSDSLSLVIKSTGPVINTSLSVSVLPPGTRAYDNNRNILTVFYLEPYIQGYINDASYYFSPGQEARKSYDLDLLLMNQGWSKFNWESSRLFRPQERFTHQKGFTIEGTLNGRGKSNRGQLFVGSDDSGMFEVVELNDDNSFEIPGSFILDSTTINIGYLSGKNSKLSKPRVDVKVHPLKEKDDLKTIPDLYRRRNSYRIPPNLSEQMENITTLDTVSLSSKKTEPEGHKTVMETWERDLKVTDQIANSYYYIIDYIATKGFLVRNENGWLKIYNMMLSTIMRDENNPGAVSEVLLYLNGAPVGTDASFLNGMLSSQVESIVINKRGYGMGGNALNGVIKINTRDGSRVASAQGRQTLENIIAGNGFSLSREFYAPRYKSYENELFRDYGAIAWKSNLVLDSLGRTELRVLDTNQPQVRLFIEGMNSEGKLISEVIDIDTNQQL